MGMPTPPTLDAQRRHDRQRLRRALNASLALVLLLAACFAAQHAFDWRFLTVTPWTLEGLSGLLTAPLLHGSVERANRTHTEEFYEVTDAPSELEALAAELAKWEVVYNTIRPHQGLGYLTPAEFLASLEGQV